MNVDLLIYKHLYKYRFNAGGIIFHKISYIPQNFNFWVTLI